MRYFHQIAEGLPVAGLAAAIARQPGLWNQHGLRKRDGSPHTQVSDIWLRYNAYEKLDPANPAAFNDEHDSVWYPAAYALPEARELCFWLMNLVRGERLGGVLITRVPAGCEIGAHVDRGWHVDYYDKYYVQLDSGPGAMFWCEDEQFEPERGDVYYFDNRKVHGVKNVGEHDRMTLIVCIRSDRYEGAR